MEVSSISHLIRYYLRSRIFSVFIETCARGFARSGGLMSKVVSRRSYLQWLAVTRILATQSITTERLSPKTTICQTQITFNYDLSDTNHFQWLKDSVNEWRSIDQRSHEVQNSWGLEQNNLQLHAKGRSQFCAWNSPFCFAVYSYLYHLFVKKRDREAKELCWL